MTTEINDVSVYPDYLREKYFNQILLQLFGETVKLRDLQVIPQKSFGNYCSDIYRVALKYALNDNKRKDGEVVAMKDESNAQNAVTRAEECVLNVLVKDLFENLSSISNEQFMYAQVLPEINKMLLSCRRKPVSPTVYHAIKNNRETHFFEDLTPRGYVIQPRTTGYNEDETRLLFKRLGEYHAASLIFKESHPGIEGKMREFYAVSDPALELFIENQMYDNIEYVVKIIETWPGYESIIAKMRTNTREVFSANLLLKYNSDDGSAEDAVFLDYQNSNCGSPAFDIHNLFMTSVQLPVMAQSYDDIIVDYYVAFRSTLLALKYSAERVPVLQCILDELRRTDYFNYYLLIFPFAQTMLGDELVKGMNFNTLHDEKRMEANRANIYSNERVLETYKYMLKAFDERGLLD
ncbi:uncharacterized protein [Bactrocera oleae]|uniref:uncharacterized protein isoform X2 n=1 Tax=Bactrocera oleae TaxID=104688 RepID=UPI00387E5292